MANQYPIAVLQDRYGEVYSGGAWLAVAAASEFIDGISTRAQFCLVGDGGPSDSDVEAGDFWTKPPDWIAVGHTPDQPIAALRMMAGEPDTQASLDNSRTTE